MNITDIRVRKIDGDSKVKAIVSFTIDDEFVIHDIKVIEGSNGLFIAMPSRKTLKGDFKDITHPITPECRTRLQQLIFEAYEKALSEPTSDSTEDSPIS